MIIVLKKDGQIVTDDGNPVEIKALENAAMILADPQDGDSIVYDAASGCWVSGAVDALPAVSGTDNGKVLKVVEGAWAKADSSGGGALMVGCTKGSGRYTLGATIGEIITAMSAGKPVIVHFPDETDWENQYSTIAGVDTYNAFVCFQGNIEQFSCSGLDDYPTLSWD